MLVGLEEREELEKSERLNVGRKEGKRVENAPRFRLPFLLSSLFFLSAFSSRTECSFFETF